MSGHDAPCLAKTNHSISAQASHTYCQAQWWRWWFGLFCSHRTWAVIRFMRSSVYQRIIKSVKGWPKRGHVLGQQSQKIYNTMTGKKKIYFKLWHWKPQTGKGQIYLFWSFWGISWLEEKNQHGHLRSPTPGPRSRLVPGHESWGSGVKFMVLRVFNQFFVLFF